MSRLYKYMLLGTLHCMRFMIMIYCYYFILSLFLLIYSTLLYSIFILLYPFQYPLYTLRCSTLCNDRTPHYIVNLHPTSYCIVPPTSTINSYLLFIHLLTYNLIKYIYTILLLFILRIIYLQ